jgi:hypothetical protein
MYIRSSIGDRSNGNFMYSIVFVFLSYIYLGYFVCVCVWVCVCVCHHCGTLSFSLCFNIQTDKKDKTEGLEMEGLEMER